MSDYEDEQEIKRLGDLVDTLRAQLAAAEGARDAAQITVAARDEELRWIDDHLFKAINLQATRDFVTERNSIEGKRLLRLCDLRDAGSALGAALAGLQVSRGYLPVHLAKIVEEAVNRILALSAPAPTAEQPSAPKCPECKGTGQVLRVYNSGTIHSWRSMVPCPCCKPAEQAVPQMVDVGNHYGDTSDGMGNWTCSVCGRHLGNGTAPMVCTGKPAAPAEKGEGK